MDPTASHTAFVGPTSARPVRAVASRPAMAPAAGRPIVRARYDAAQSDRDSARHWANADGLSARAANVAFVRHRLRTRARYERDNNPYCQGIALTLANDLIGTGPRLQLATADEDLNRRVADAFEEWAAAVGLAEKLRTMRQAKVIDGEGFALLWSNPKVRGPVQLDLKLIEADQVTTPSLNLSDPWRVDGIEFDRDYNPTYYHVLKTHPGDLVANLWDYERVPAEAVLHWFRSDRPGQARGIPEITSALPLFAELRRYTRAVVAAAETAADFAAVLQSAAPADGASDDADPFEAVEIDRRMMTTLPAGYTMAQFKAEQPTTTYGMFKQELLNEIARCLNVPYNVAAGNSAGYNYASGRLDHQVYYKSISVDQYHLETAILDRVFRAWLDEARFVPGLIPALPAWPHQWHWDGWSHVDPLKEASAQETRLKNRTTTLADEWARRGCDWRSKLRQIAVEERYAKELGLTGAQAAPGPAMPPVPPPDDGEEDDGTDD